MNKFYPPIEYAIYGPITLFLVAIGGVVAFAYPKKKKVKVSQEKKDN